MVWIRSRDLFHFPSRPATKSALKAPVEPPVMTTRWLIRLGVSFATTPNWREGAWAWRVLGRSWDKSLMRSLLWFSRSRVYSFSGHGWSVWKSNSKRILFSGGWSSSNGNNYDRILAIQQPLGFPPRKLKRTTMPSINGLTSLLPNPNRPEGNPFGFEWENRRLKSISSIRPGTEFWASITQTGSIWEAISPDFARISLCTWNTQRSKEVWRNASWKAKHCKLRPRDTTSMGSKWTISSFRTTKKSFGLACTWPINKS